MTLKCVTPVTLVTLSIGSYSCHILPFLASNVHEVRPSAQLPTLYEQNRARQGPSHSYWSRGGGGGQVDPHPCHQHPHTVRSHGESVMTKPTQDVQLETAEGGGGHSLLPVACVRFLVTEILGRLPYGSP